MYLGIAIFFFFKGSGDHRHLHSFPTRRSSDLGADVLEVGGHVLFSNGQPNTQLTAGVLRVKGKDRKSTRLNSSHTVISYAVFCLKKKIISRYLDSLKAWAISSALSNPYSAT